jgi:serine/threonine protein kinase
MDHGKWFMVMEPLGGPSLREQLASGPLRTPKAPLSQVISPWSISDQMAVAAHRTQVENAYAAIEVALKILAGLGAAHERGLVHTEINPDNIVLGCEPKIINFDAPLVRRMSIQSSSKALQGVPDAIEFPVNVLAYVSREQVLGKLPDPRSDLFSVGSILYEMATGQKAFPDTDPNLLAESIARRPTNIPITLRSTGVRSLDEVVVKALELDRGMRYQNVADMRQALEGARKVAKELLKEPQEPDVLRIDYHEERPPSFKEHLKARPGRWTMAVLMVLMLLMLFFAMALLISQRLAR